jgi:hypothetical protein
MQSLLEVLHQNSLSLRDPQAIADELDTIVRQSEASDRAVREMEAMLRSGESAWAVEFPDDAVGPAAEPQKAAPAPPRQRERGR